ncbi:uncharacterized protein PHA67_023699 isoform 1-T2 [Liasis olivaceus]
MASAAGARPGLPTPPPASQLALARLGVRPRVPWRVAAQQPASPRYCSNIGAATGGGAAARRALGRSRGLLRAGRREVPLLALPAPSAALPTGTKLPTSPRRRPRNPTWQGAEARARPNAAEGEGRRGVERPRAARPALPLLGAAPPRLGCLLRRPGERLGEARG